MANRRSMRGASIDLAKLMARQEKNITVGNTKTNARGDQLGKGGRIVKTADELAREHYNRNDPKAVVQGGIKIDDDTPEIQNTRVQEVEKPVEDDWVEPTPPPAEPKPKAKAVEEDDPWVEDKDGNFVRKSEQEQHERVSKSTSKKQQPAKKNK